MTIPKHDEIRVPALSLLSDHGQLKLSEFEAPLAEHFGLTEDELHEEYESGNGKIFYDRISWALSYMNMAGLLNKPKRGIYEISSLGSEKLASPDGINDFVAAELSKKQKSKPAKQSQVVSDQDSLTPQEELYASAQKIRESSRLLIFSPRTTGLGTIQKMITHRGC